MGKEKRPSDNVKSKEANIPGLIQAIRGIKGVPKESAEDLRRSGVVELLNKEKAAATKKLELADPFLIDGYARIPSDENSKCEIIVAVFSASDSYLVVQPVGTSDMFNVERKKAKLLSLKKLKKIQKIYGISQIVSPVVPFERMIAGTVFGGRVRITRLNLLLKTAMFDLLDGTHRRYDGYSGEIQNLPKQVLEGLKTDSEIKNEIELIESAAREHARYLDDAVTWGTQPADDFRWQPARIAGSEFGYVALDHWYEDPVFGGKWACWGIIDGLITNQIVNVSEKKLGKLYDRDWMPIANRPENKIILKKIWDNFLNQKRWLIPVPPARKANVSPHVTGQRKFRKKGGKKKAGPPRRQSRQKRGQMFFEE